MTERLERCASVVIPLFNKRDFIVRAIESVLQQSWRDFELVVVDDGSTDGSDDLVARIRDPRLRLIRQANAGPGAARNAGWRAGRGRFAAFLDADDFWHDDYLQWGVETLLERAEIAACTSGHAELTRRGMGSPDERSWSRRGLRPGVFRLTPETDIAALVATLTYMSPVTTIARRAVLETYGGFYYREKCNYGEDSFLWLQVLLNHPVLVDFTQRVVVDRTGSSLSTLSTLATRSIEPILSDPDGIRARCPKHLQPKLDLLLALKASKRACTLAAVGKWAEGDRLRRKFRAPGLSRHPFGIASVLMTNPAGSVAARAALRALEALRAH